MRSTRHLLARASCVLLPLLAPPLQARQCPAWSDEFSARGADGPVRAQLALPGAVPELVVGGEFQFLGGTHAPYLASWDGATWSAVTPVAPPGPVQALARFDAGGGAQLYVGGVGFLARWTGAAWEQFPLSGEVFALHVHDDGGGPALFVGGQMTSVAGLTVRGIARYDGAWSALNGGLNSGTALVRAFATHDDGSGPALFVGGTYTSIGGVTARCLARWDGSTFSEVGGGMDGSTGHGTLIRDLCSITRPNGVTELHVGGKFTGAGGTATSRWIAWTQGAWLDVGGNEGVTAFTVRAEPGGDVVCAARESGVERWDGAVRTLLPVQVPKEGLSLRAFGSALPQDLFLGTQDFIESGSFLSRWDGTGWQPLLPGLGLPGYVAAVGVHDFGGGEELVAIRGSLTDDVLRALRYDGSSWTPLGGDGALSGGLFRDLHSGGGELYVAGAVGGAYVRRWDGATWAALGSGGSGWASGLATFDSGSGPQLYVCGYADTFGAPDTRGLAVWDGSAWTDVGGGITGPGGITTHTVWRLTPFGTGASRALFAGGVFAEAGGVAASSIASWDGASWHDVGGGVTHGAGSPTIFDMVSMQGPVGELLVVTGAFDHAGGVPAWGIAAWDGSTWSPLGSGLEKAGQPGVGIDLIAHDPDGLGEHLYVLGSFDHAGGVPTQNVAEWDGLAWQPTTLPSTSQSRMTTYDDGHGRALFLGGMFREAGGVGSQNIAKWSDPCGESLGIPTCASTSNSTGWAATLRASGSAHVTDADITLVAHHVPAGSLTLLFNGTMEVRGLVGDGTRCLGGSVLRMLPAGFAQSDGTYTQVFDFQAPYAANAIAGVSLHVQAFYRDLQGGPAGFNTTDALRILLRP